MTPDRPKLVHISRTPTDLDALLTEAQAADLLNLSVRTLQVWRWNDRGPLVVRAGRAVRYRRRDLLAWMDDNTAGKIR
jgi:Helix-turn-helix domain